MPAWAEVQPQAISLGGGAFQLTPTLSLTQTHDDNIFRQATNETSSWVTKIQPRLQLITGKGSDLFGLTYQGDYGSYETSSGDNYDDHTFSAAANFHAGSRSTIELGASYAKLHDARGQGSSEGTIALSRPEPDRYDSSSIAGTWNFGNEGAPFGFSLTGSSSKIEYQNNRIETQFRDQTQNLVGGKLYARLAGKTRAFLNYSEQTFEYDKVPLFGPRLDSTQKATSVGIEWQATAKTSGSIEVGSTSKDFDSNSRTDSTNGSWTVGITWMPKTYSTVSFTSSRAPQESNGTGSFIESVTNSLGWNHEWSSVLSTTAMASYGIDTFKGNPRKDTRSIYTVGFDYDVYRWLNVGFNFENEKRNSSDQTFDYDRNAFTFKVSASL